MSIDNPSALELIQATEVIIGGESLDSLENDEFSARNLIEAAGVDTTGVGYVDSAIERAVEMASHELFEVGNRWCEDEDDTIPTDLSVLERAAFTFVRARLLRQLTNIAGSMDADTQLESESEIVQEFKRMI